MLNMDKLHTTIQPIFSTTVQAATNASQNVPTLKRNYQSNKSGSKNAARSADNNKDKVINNINILEEICD